MVTINRHHDGLMGMCLGLIKLSGGWTHEAITALMYANYYYTLSNLGPCGSFIPFISSHMVGNIVGSSGMNGSQITSVRIYSSLDSWQINDWIWSAHSICWPRALAALWDLRTYLSAAMIRLLGDMTIIINVMMKRACPLHTRTTFYATISAIWKPFAGKFSRCSEHFAGHKIK